MNRRLLPIAAAAATGIQVGAAMVATRFVVGQVGPASLALLRYAIGFCCLVPPLLVMLRRSPLRFRGRDLPPIALLGIVQFGVLIALLNYGLRTVPSARAALIFATFPLLTMLLAAALGRETLSPARTSGVLLSIAGVAVALGEKVVTATATATTTAAAAASHGWSGELAIAAAAFSGATCSVLYRPYLSRYPTLPVGALAMLASVAFLVVPAAGEGLFATPLRLSAIGWAAVLFIGVSSGIGYYLWLWALARAPATQVAVFLSLSPVTAALLGALLLGEGVATGTIAGLACVVLGLWLAHRETVPRSPAPIGSHRL